MASTPEERRSFVQAITRDDRYRRCANVLYQSVLFSTRRAYLTLSHSHLQPGSLVARILYRLIGLCTCFSAWVQRLLAGHRERTLDLLTRRLTDTDGSLN
jgi:hypothetical protein